MQAVLDYLVSNESRFIADLSNYVRIPSVSAQPSHAPDMQRAAEWIRDHCRGIGLEAELHPTPGNPVLIARTPRQKNRKRPHYLVYGHYDVQPPEPFELWHSAPFEPIQRGRSLFGRGASDNKGQHLAHLNAIEAYLKTGTELPCDLTFLIEGEEEIGSNHLAQFLRTKRNELKCDGVVISDTGIPSLKQPALTCALRGIVAFELKVIGPNRDLHSGLFGGSVDNPALVLCQMLAKTRDSKGRITIPGFYDEVVKLTSAERREMAKLPFNERKESRFLGVPQLFGEKGFTIIEQRGTRPTLEINGLTSGYQGIGNKTIVPSWASAKITCRLVPNQKPEGLRKKIIQYLRTICPPTVKLQITSDHGGEPYHVSSESPQAQAALRALRSAFGHEPVLLREGGSIPIVNDFKKILGVDTLLLGLALPDDNAHSPNEKFNLDCYAKGMRLGALLWQELGRVSENDSA